MYVYDALFVLRLAVWGRWEKPYVFLVSQGLILFVKHLPNWLTYLIITKELIFLLRWNEVYRRMMTWLQRLNDWLISLKRSVILSVELTTINFNMKCNGSTKEFYQFDDTSTYILGIVMLHSRFIRIDSFIMTRLFS